jgi:thymidine kinase
MFAGKSTTLYRYVERALRAKKTVEVVLPAMDRRNKGHGGKTHTGKTIDTLVKPREVECSREVFTGLSDPRPDLLVIDEGQFFDMDLPLWVLKLEEKHPDLHVIVGGLDMTSEMAPFGPMGHLLAIAGKIKKLKAICECGRKASRTTCTVKKDGAVLVGAAPYIPTCPRCWQKYYRQGNL